MAEQIDGEDIAIFSVMFLCIVGFIVWLSKTR